MVIITELPVKEPILHPFVHDGIFNPPKLYMYTHVRNYTLLPDLHCVTECTLWIIQ